MDSKNTQKLIFNINYKSKGLNDLIANIFNNPSFPSPPQPKYRQRLRDTLRLILINLNDLESSPSDYISYSRNRSLASKNKYSVDNVCKVIDTLGNMGFVENHKGFNDRENKEQSRQARVRGNKELVRLFQKYGICQSEYSQDPPNSGLIILRERDTKKDIEFPPTRFTRQIEENVKKINHTLSEHQITWKNGYTVHNKYLHRVFNGDFEHGGRFYGRGGNWQGFPGGSKTRSLIKIDGQPTIELDYSAYHPTILYDRAKKTRSKEPYKLEGYSGEVKNFLKKALLTILNADTRTKAIRSVQHEIYKGKIRKPREVNKISEVINDFVSKHNPIKDSFFTGIGRKLQYWDSEICEYILLYFQSRDIPVLPVHDSFIIDQEYEEELKLVMKTAYKIKFGQDIQVDKKN